MSFSAERAAIEGHFNTSWSNVSNTYRTVAVVYDNAPIKQKSEFLFFRIVNGDGRQAEISNGQDQPVLCRYTGLVQVDILAKAESGNDRTRKMADQIASIFRRRQLIASDGSFITFQVPSIRVFGSMDTLFRTIVTCPFYRDTRE